MRLPAPPACSEWPANLGDTSADREFVRNAEWVMNGAIELFRTAMLSGVELGKLVGLRLGRFRTHCSPDVATRFGFLGTLMSVFQQMPHHARPADLVSLIAAAVGELREVGLLIRRRSEHHAADRLPRAILSWARLCKRLLNRRSPHFNLRWRWIRSSSTNRSCARRSLASFGRSTCTASKPLFRSEARPARASGRELRDCHARAATRSPGGASRGDDYLRCAVMVSAAPGAYHTLRN